MKQTEEQIKRIVEKTLKDLDMIDKKEFNESYEIKNVNFQESEEILRGPNKNKTKAVWNASVLSRNDITGQKFLFFTILDDTATPLYFQSSQVSIAELAVDKEGKVYRVNKAK